MNFFSIISASINTTTGITPTEPSLDAASTDVVLVFDGDSLTNGTSDSGINQYYPKQVDAHFDGIFKSKEFYSYGVNGQTMGEMIADADTQIHPKVKAGKQNILIGWEDVNGIYGGYVTVQQRYNEIIQYFQEAKSAGFEHCILITGFYPRKSDDGKYWYGGTNMTQAVADNESRHEELLDMINAIPINDAPWDMIIDLREDPDIGGPRGQFKNEHFGDYVHLFASGYDIVASYVINKINSIFNI